jgi:hypothetical protein
MGSKKDIYSWILAAAVVGMALSTLASSENLSSVTKSQICKAGVAKVMGRDPSIIRIDRQTNGVVYLSYVRNNDGSLWSYKCKIDGSLIIWGSETGRWRDHLTDPEITYRVQSKTIYVEEKYSDGSMNKKPFDLNQIVEK